MEFHSLKLSHLVIFFIEAEHLKFDLTLLSFNNTFQSSEKIHAFSQDRLVSYGFPLLPSISFTAFHFKDTGVHMRLSQLYCWELILYYAMLHWGEVARHWKVFPTQ